MAQNFAIAMASWGACLVMTILVSLVTRPKPESELHNLVYGVTDIPTEVDRSWYERPGVLAIIVAMVLIVVNIIFW
jgi:SSS family solute:Na+ symporter